ncbi:hypothetical protein Mal15_43650 [Stieleria maiorica]|uniref:Uncharacterized protein n=1 Tax=Stieleria maiorica TaxID=2795974 RepID=A0A5B9MKU5_9BACT|nr:hypothetical protein Mal15_43650 [Stieleria maiorica]
MGSADDNNLPGEMRGRVAVSIDSERHRSIATTGIFPSKACDRSVNRGIAVGRGTPPLT